MGGSLRGISRKELEMAKRPLRQLTGAIRGRNVVGYDKTKRRIARLRGLHRNTIVLLRESAEEIVKIAREHVPVDTGLLYSTIQSRETPAGFVVSAGDPNPEPPTIDSIPRRKTLVPIPSNKEADYALIVHETHRDPYRRKFLERAFVAVVDPLKEKYLRKIVKDAVKG